MGRWEGGKASRQWKQGRGRHCLAQVATSHLPVDDTRAVSARAVSARAVSARAVSARAVSARAVSARADTPVCPLGPFPTPLVFGPP